jgi:hypothetical protein
MTGHIPGYKSAKSLARNMGAELLSLQAHAALPEAGAEGPESHQRPGFNQQKRNMNNNRVMEKKG